MLTLRYTVFSLCLIISLTLASFAFAATYSSALNAYERGNYYRAIQQFKQLAHQNHPDGQYMLGKMYALGQGTNHDNILAFKWLYLAAESGVQSARNLKKNIHRRLSPSEKQWAKQLIRTFRTQYNRKIHHPEYARPETVYRVQRQLAALGYFHHHIDGILGNKTRKAIRKYQKDKLMVVDGRITQPLVESLYIASYAKPGKQYGENIVTNYHDTDAYHGQRLQKLIRTGKKQQAAAPWFLEKLEKIARQLNGL